MSVWVKSLKAEKVSVPERTLEAFRAETSVMAGMRACYASVK